MVEVQSLAVPEPSDQSCEWGEFEQFRCLLENLDNHKLKIEF